MKIVQFSDGRFAVRKWLIVYCYADNSNFERWGWWLRGHVRHAKVDTLEEAKIILAKVLHPRDYGKAV